MGYNSPIYPLIPEQVANMQIMTDIANMSAANIELMKENKSLQKELAVANRKKRRQAVRKELGTNIKDEIVVYTQYDDGAIEEVFFVLNARGQMNLYIVSPEDYYSTEAKMAVIMLEQRDNRIPVVGFLEYMKHGRYIYQQMLTAGVRFNPELPCGQIYKLLEEWFFKVRSGANVITGKILHGWKVNEQEARYLENSILNDFPDIAARIGIRLANFERIELTEERKRRYVAEWLQFEEHDTRVLMFMAPFIGLLKSLTDKYIGGQTLCINLVAISDIPISMISSWIQVLDRDFLSDGEIEQSDKDRRRRMEQLNDENLIIDIRGYTGESNYSLNKKRNFLAQCADLVRNQRYISGTKKKLSASVFSVSNSYVADGMCNIILPDHNQIDSDQHKAFVDGKCLEAVMTAVVDFIHSDFANVVQILRKSRTGDINQKIFSAIAEVLQKFFEYEGIDILEELQIANDFSIYFEHIEYGEDVLEIFVKTVRSGMHQYKVVDKYCSNYEERVIYYDTNYIYFPGAVLMEIYQEVHRGKQWKKALIWLREKGDLSTSAPDILVKKLQIGGVRRDFYVVKRDIFNQDGYVEVIELAKGGTEA